MKIFAQKRFRHRLWALVLIAGLLMGGCAAPDNSPAPQGAEPVVGSAPVDSALVESVPAEVDPGDNQVAEADTPTESAILEEEVSPEESVSPKESVVAATQPAPKPTPRAELHASDPSGVTLAAGKPQLVEFFAFW